MVDFLMSALRLSIPILLAALGGLWCERSGVINIALEGFILLGAFFAAVIAYYTQSVELSWILTFIFSVVASQSYCWMVIRMKAPAIIVGTAFNFFIIGLIPLISKLIFQTSGSTPSIDQSLRSSLSVLTLVFVTILFSYFTIYKTHWGLQLRAAGDKPSALYLLGYSVLNVRWIATSLGCGFAALSGATLSTYFSSAYSPLISGGRGFMAIATLIVGRWRLWPTMGAAILFGFLEAIQIRSQSISIFSFQIPLELIQISPYLLTILLIFTFRSQNQGPEALGKNEESS